MAGCEADEIMSTQHCIEFEETEHNQQVQIHVDTDQMCWGTIVLILLGEETMRNLGRASGWVITLAICILMISVYLCYRAFYSIPDRSLLTGLPFAEQGWQGIIPGETTKEEALNVLKSSPYVRQASIRVSPGTPEVEHIYWDNKRLSFRAGASPRLKNRAVVGYNRIAAIRLHLSENITVEQAITHFGDPKAVAWHETRDWQGAIYIAAYLLYPDQGFALHSIATFSRELTPESPVTQVYYYEPMSVDELSNTIGPLLYMDLSQTESWTGYTR